jgi:hypothetical protein
MVCRRSGAHTGNRNKRSTSTERGKEVEHEHQVEGDEPSASKDSRWQTVSDSTASK